MKFLEFCIKFVLLVISNKVNEALQVLLFLTYRDPLSIDVITKWGKISIDLVSKKNYWIDKIGSELFPNDTNILVNLSALCAGPNSYSEAKNNLVEGRCCLTLLACRRITI